MGSRGEAGGNGPSRFENELAEETMIRHMVKWIRWAEKARQGRASQAQECFDDDPSVLSVGGPDPTVLSHGEMLPAGRRGSALYLRHPLM